MSERESGETLAVAWNLWSESDEGRECEEPNLPALPKSRQYLRNRLWRAFMAGADAATRIQARERVERLPPESHAEMIARLDQLEADSQYK